MVDDENSSRIVLKELLSSFCREISVVGEASGVDEAYVVISDKKPDLIFLDIKMPTGTGFSLLKKFESVPFEVIFITGYDTYAIQAIRFSALDYLLKPVAVPELQEAVKRALHKFENNFASQKNVVNLLQNEQEEGVNKKIALHKNDSVHFIKISDISHIESDWNYSTIYTQHHEVFSSAKTLKEFEEYLRKFNCFVRIHKSCLMNANHILQYTKGEPCIVTMQNGTELEISRRKKQEVLEILKSTSRARA